jgi:DnaJ-class molecular chaperone
MAGPIPPHDSPDFDLINTPHYLTGYAAKIKADIKRVVDLYNGVAVKVFTLDESGTRCPDCVDTFTGQVMYSNCATCGGTGFVLGYTYICETKAMVQFSPKIKTDTEMGSSEGSGRRDTFILVDVPLLEDQDLVVTVDTRRVYKIVDSEPHIVAVGGEIIYQMASCAPLSKGAPEYGVVSW